MLINGENLERIAQERPGTRFEWCAVGGIVNGHVVPFSFLDAVAGQPPRFPEDGPRNGPGFSMDMTLGYAHPGAIVLVAYPGRGRGGICVGGNLMRFASGFIKTIRYFPATKSYSWDVQLDQPEDGLDYEWSWCADTLYEDPIVLYNVSSLGAWGPIANEGDKVRLGWVVGGGGTPYMAVTGFVC